MSRPHASPVREHPPSQALRPWVECFWTMSIPAGQRVLPDGCADLLFDFASSGEERAYVVGPMTTALVVPARAAALVLGVRFRPGAAGPFLGVPLALLVDRRVALADLWPDAAAVRERIEAGTDAGGAAAAVDAFDRELRARLPRVAAPDPRIRAAVERLAGAPAGTSIRCVAAQLGITRQHLARRFRDEVGYGPKTLARIYRLRGAVGLLGRGAAVLADVALAAGYYDQAHMNAEFRVLAGRSPLELQR